MLRGQREANLRESTFSGFTFWRSFVVAGCAVNDSPVGLAAYLLEKFSTWTDLKNRDLEDGGLERYKMLGPVVNFDTNVFVYLFSTGKCPCFQMLGSRVRIHQHQCSSKNNASFLNPNSHMEMDSSRCLWLIRNDGIYTENSAWMTSWQTSWSTGPQAPSLPPCASTRRTLRIIFKEWMRGMWPSIVHTTDLTVSPCYVTTLTEDYIFVLGWRCLCPPDLQPSPWSSCIAPSHGHKLSIETSSPTLSCLEVVTLPPLKSPTCSLTTFSVLSRKWRSSEALSELSDQLWHFFLYYFKQETYKLFLHWTFLHHFVSCCLICHVQFTDRCKHAHRSYRHPFMSPAWIKKKSYTLKMYCTNSVYCSVLNEWKTFNKL